MLSRLLPKPSHFRILYHLSPKSHPYPGNPDFPSLSKLSRFLSSNHNNNNNNRDKGQSDSNTWKFSHESDGKFDHLFTESSENLAGNTDADSRTNEPWLEAKGGENDDVFEGVDREVGGKGGGEVGDGEEWMTEAWKFGEEEQDDVFDIGEVVREVGETGGESQGVESDRSEEEKRLKREEQELSAIIKGPNRAFGDLIAASGITDAMLDSLIALKDLNEIQGLPPLSEIEDMRYEKSTRKSIRSEIERLKQEEAAKARVRQVDGKGRAYGTGRRKCSVARVWIQPGDGKFIINDKQFDVYFPMLDHRAALLRPFSETKTLGLWDVNCTVKGGGVSGQVGAILLGVSRALQNWEPDLRPALRSEGFLTRDPRVVERKKPGKAKARKSFQWVKR